MAVVNLASGVNGAAPPTDSKVAVSVGFADRRVVGDQIIEAADLRQPSARIQVRLGGAQTSAELLLPRSLHFVCIVGARGIAPSCRPVHPARSGSVLFGPEPSRRVVGQIKIGKEWVEKGRVSLTPQGIKSRVPFTWPLFVRDGRVIREVETDREGRFEIPPLPFGSFRLEMRSPGGRIYTVSDVRVQAAKREGEFEGPEEERPLNLGVLQFEQGESLEVSVTDGFSQPIPGAGVQVLQEKDGKWVTLDGVTDQTGSVRLSGVESRWPSSVNCIAQGYARARITFVEVPPTVWIQLDRLGVVKGVVATPDGDPVSGATVEVQDAGKSARSDYVGAFRLADLAAGPVTLRVNATGFRRKTLTAVREPEEELDLGVVVLSTAGGLVGRVVDALSGAGIPGARVETESEFGGASAISGPDGEFALTAVESSVTVRVTADGFAPRRAELAEGGVASDANVIRLHQGGKILVRAWDEDADAPCAACSFVVQGSASPVSALETNDEGEVVSSPLPPGFYVVMREHVQTVGNTTMVRAGEDAKPARVEDARTTAVTFGEHKGRLIVRLSQPVEASFSVAGRGGSMKVFGKRTGPAEFEMRRTASTPMAFSLDSSEGSVPLGSIGADYQDSTVSFDVPESGAIGQVRCGALPFRNELLVFVGLTGLTRDGWVKTNGAGSFVVRHLAEGVWAFSTLRAGRPLGQLRIARGAVASLGTLTLPASACPAP